MFVEYYSGGAGGVCNNETDIIRSKWECYDALKELGFDHNDHYWQDEGNPWCPPYPIPSGCSIQKGGELDKFIELILICETGVGRRRFNKIPICKRNSDTGNTFIFICFRKRIHKF